MSTISISAMASVHPACSYKNICGHDHNSVVFFDGICNCNRNDINAITIAQAQQEDMVDREGVNINTVAT